MNITKHWIVVFPVGQSVVVFVRTADSVRVVWEVRVFVAGVVVGLTMDIDVPMEFRRYLAVWVGAVAVCVLHRRTLTTG